MSEISGMTFEMEKSIWDDCEDERESLSRNEIFGDLISKKLVNQKASLSRPSGERSLRMRRALLKFCGSFERTLQRSRSLL